MHYEKSSFRIWGIWVTNRGGTLEGPLVHRWMPCGSWLDGDLQGTSVAHLVQCLLIVLEFENVRDLIRRFQNQDLWVSDDQDTPFPWS